MKRIEQYGVELALLMRRKVEAERVLAEIQEKISFVENRITYGEGELYEEASREWPAVPDERPTQRMVLPEHSECPGAVCWLYRQGTPHAHASDGSIWQNS